MRKTITILIFAALALCQGAQAEGRRIYTVNDGWRFTRGEQFEAYKPALDDSAWELVHIPHTWNAEDGDDDVPGYYRGPSWYRKTVFVDSAASGKRAVLYFEGANQVAEVWVNGDYVGKHTGGYTRFSFDVTASLKTGRDNIIAVRLTNQYDPNIPPLSADFTFYGGIYRDVYLCFTDEVHLATHFHASSGVFVTTPEVSRTQAKLSVRAMLANDSKAARNVRLEHSLRDAQGREAAQCERAITLNPDNRDAVAVDELTVPHPRLWDVDDPYRYGLYTRLYDADEGRLLDEVYNPVGIRTFSFDPADGFTLNGRGLKLTGTNRHQDYLRMGNALRDEMHVRDILLLKEMGGNFLRVAHYPQDPVLMEMCDKLGIVTSVEIPVVNAITAGEAFTRNCLGMLTEMVWQDFNRPSIMIWAYMNEILLRMPYGKDDPRIPQYYKDAYSVAKTLDDALRGLDPTRYTMMAFHNNPPAYEAAGLTDIPQIHGWNLYQGWYEPDINEFQRLLDRAREKYPDKVLLVTEFGPGVDPRVHSYDGERFDFSQEYGLTYHRHYYREMMQRKFIAGFNVWNLNDFYMESRVDAVPHVNNKGLTGLGRERKDGYLFYQAVLKKEPVLWIGQREWKTRGGVSDVSPARGSTQTNSRSTSGQNPLTCTQQVPVFTNQPDVELSLNGRSLGRKKVSGGVAFFDVPFTDGLNRLSATAGSGSRSIRDAVSVNFKLTPARLGADFKELNVMLGSHRYFEDREAEMVWIPEQPYMPGSWGFVGGEAYRRKTGFGTMLGSEIDIHGTINNPVFQTQRQGIRQFCADVPDGLYSIYLYWAELESDKQPEGLAYNLGADAIAGNFEKRVFDVSINGSPVLKDFDIVSQYGYARAVIKKVQVIVSDGQGITVDFDAKHGQTVLNAIRIYRNY